MRRFFGHGVHEKLHAMIETWAGVFDVSEDAH